MNQTLKGFGLGLRPEHYADFLAQAQPVDWLEVISDNYLVPGGKPLYYLDKIRQDYPMVMHGVAMNLGSVDPLDFNYLAQIKALAKRIEPLAISDHLCWTGVDGQYLHDLLPIPYTEEAIKHVAGRIRQVQDFLGRRLVIENASTYLEAQADLQEWEFISAILQEADCQLLLDINNIYVSSRNHGFDPQRYLQAIPRQRIAYLHLAGHTDHGDHCIDTHDQPICAEVWSLYTQAISQWGAIPTMIERDANIPALPELLAELNHARQRGAAHVSAHMAA
ncbi:MNIO family bufferin maturase [Iodobacter fluviatilis]|uniref:UPF0276 protein EV682_101645 n=1 Tax=Iodobacter fluviatilis TaxID=537 RepID=A0A377Q4A9_9NEIS|nr:DUF692 domain-containing protein [Iodobacter fluviatilis]TCU90605.1 hypothetical protein EV682_101645 [Iodobacter fluviatilis]STQ89632.1 Protein of uncharacterised function (DUF692) [Iodobacter fluviatilis]